MRPLFLALLLAPRPACAGYCASLESCKASDPRARPQSGAEFLKELDAALST